MPPDPKNPFEDMPVQGPFPDPPPYNPFEKLVPFREPNYVIDPEPDDPNGAA